MVGTNEGRRELWGYITWLTAGVVIAVPEVSAAASGRVPWATISETVGHLEARATWVAPLVVGYLVFAAYHAVPHLSPGAQVVTPAGQPRTEGGRLTAVPSRHDDVRDRMPTTTFVVFAIVALGVVVAGTLVAATVSSDRYVVGYVLYGLIAVFWVLVPTILAYWFKKDVPFPPLSTTLGYLERRWHVVAVLVLAGLAVLALHLAFYPWPDIIRDLQPANPAAPHP
jgi:hypothetical protein